MEAVAGTFLELLSCVEFTSRLIDGVDEYGTYSQNVGGLLNSHQRFLQQCFAQSFAMLLPVNSETRQHSHRYRVICQAFSGAGNGILFFDASR